MQQCCGIPLECASEVHLNMNVVYYTVDGKFSSLLHKNISAVAYNDKA